jgi:hypothetical protein
VALASEVASYAAAQDDVVALAHADLVRWWAELDTSDGRAAAAALEAFMTELTAAYGSVAAALGADFYDTLREAAGAPNLFRADLADPVPPRQVEAAARWAAGPLFGGEGPNAALEHAAGAVQRLVVQPARDTIALNVTRDPARPGWARVPRGKGCAFCRMLAGRGAVYSSAKAAGQMNSYHDHCKCTATPVWRGQKLPYDADELEQQYRAARENASGGSTKAALAQLRQDEGIR